MYRKYLKRLFDLILSVFLLVLLSPVFLFIAVIIKMSSEGPVFFRQQRGGKDGSYFTIFKFRSMAVDRCAEKSGFEPGSKMRVTGIGKILRKTKLDETAQLINIFRGEMSFVGPRPEVKKYIKLYPQRWEKVLSVKPGITDSASIKYRNEEEILADSDDPETEYRQVILPKKLDLYEQYVDTISFFTDIKIIFKTFWVIIFS